MTSTSTSTVSLGDMLAQSALDLRNRQSTLKAMMEKGQISADAAARRIAISQAVVDKLRLEYLQIQSNSAEAGKLAGDTTIAPLEALARQLGVPFAANPENTSAAGVSRYAMALARRIAAHKDDEIHPGVAGLASLFGSAIAVAAGDAARVRIARTIVDFIKAIDDEDGKPTDDGLRALRACALMLRFAIDQPMATAWPMHSGTIVAELVVGMSSHEPGFKDRRTELLRDTLAMVLVP